jgi:hypothetical protein
MKSYLKPPKELRNGFKDKERLAKIAAMSCIACDKADLKQLFRTEVHHLIGCGIGKKASDLFTIPLCSFHHRLGNKGEAVHSGIKSFEANFGTQEDFLIQVNKVIEKNAN